MSDYFNNLVARSFQPGLAPATAPESMLTPSIEDPAGRPVPDRFDDPFARALEADPFATESERTPMQTSPHLVRQELPVAANRESKESSVIDESEAQTTALHHAIRPAATKSAPEIAPRTLKVDSRHPVDDPIALPDTGPSPANAPAIEASPTRFEPPPYLSRPNSSTLPKPVTAQNFVASPKRSEPAHDLPSLPSSRRFESPPYAKRSMQEAGSRPNVEKDSAAASDRNRTLPSVIERVVLQQIMNPGESAEPATSPLTVLIPKPSPRPLPPVTVKTSSNQPGEGRVSAVETPPPDTVVNVTIGRIEVRATPPPAKSEKQRFSPRLMTLDDYMRRRSGGAL